MNKKVIFVVGPTGAGKSRLAIEIARKYNGSIVNADSIQFYEDLKIGSASPSSEDLKQAPHYLYSYVKAPLEMTAGAFLRDFYQLIETEKKLSFPLIVVGGTGFYIQALEKGMYNVPPIDASLKIEIEEEIKLHGNEKAYKELIAFDPQTKVHPNDTYRIGRALEVKRAFNFKMSELKEQSEQDTKYKLPFAQLKVGVDLEKDVLKANIQKRTTKMLNDGLLDEVKSLLEKGYADWAPLNSVGYFEAKECLQGKTDRTGLADAINQSTYKLIKKQRTWFKRDQEIQWTDNFLSVSEAIKHFLN